MARSFGRMERVENLDPKMGSAFVYWRILVMGEDGEAEWLLLTQGELAEIRDRVAKNPEDLKAKLGIADKMAVRFDTVD
jgi:hypothetical protein